MELTKKTIESPQLHTVEKNVESSDQVEFPRVFDTMAEVCDDKSSSRAVGSAL